MKATARPADRRTSCSPEDIASVVVRALTLPRTAEVTEFISGR